MDDAALVRGAQRVEHAEHQRHRLARRQGAAVLAQMGAERGTLDVLEHQVRPTAGLLGFVGLEHRHDVRVRQAADRARFVQPGPDGVAVGLEQLERHFTLEPRVVGQPDHRLGAAAEFAQQLEAADALWNGGAGHAVASVLWLFSPAQPAGAALA